jgi:hypothetical protein
MRSSYRWQMVGLVLLVAFWGAKALNSLLLHEYREALLVYRKPMFLNGLQLTIPGDTVTPSVFLPPSDMHPRSRYLLFLSSDECDASRRQERSWMELMTRVPFEVDDRILVLSTAGGAISQRLADAAVARGVAVRLGMVNDVAGFSQATGLSWTPAVAVLDHALRVRLASPSATAVFVDQVHEFFRAASPSSTSDVKEGG